MSERDYVGAELMFVEEVLRREGLDVRFGFGMMPGALHNKTCLVVAIGKAAPPVREFYDRNGAAIVHEVNDRPGTALVDDGDGLRAIGRHLGGVT